MVSYRVRKFFGIQLQNQADIANFVFFFFRLTVHPLVNSRSFKVI